MVCMEVRGEAVLDRLGAGLAGEHASFGGRFPTLHVY